MIRSPISHLTLLCLAVPLLFSCSQTGEGERGSSAPKDTTADSSQSVSSDRSEEKPSSEEKPTSEGGFSSDDKPATGGASSSESQGGGTSSSVSEEETGLEFQTISGSFDYRDAGATAKTSGTALITNEFLREGTVKMMVAPKGDRDAGILFKGDSALSSYYSLHVESYNGNQLVLSKCVDGTLTKLKSCYISAGHTKDANIELKAIVKDGKIQCFYENKLYLSQVDSSPLNGSYIGVRTANDGSVFENISISREIEFSTVDTLITGHSYMEMWSNYKKDLARYPDIFNIGIGGTSSWDWAGHVEEVADYHPSRLIYMIGINDVGWGTAPAKYIQYVKNYIDPVLERLPEVQIALVSVNQCPQYKSSATSIAQMNALLRSYVAKTDRVYYANVDDAFLKEDLTPDDSCFKDGLHPTDASYLTIRDAIYDAFDGKNQPQDSPSGGETTDPAAGTALVSGLKANNPSSDWSFVDNKVTMNSAGDCLSSSVYGDFSVVLDFTGVNPSQDTNDNPFFSHKATKGFLFGGSKNASGVYQGYALNVSYDWFEILKLNGTSSTFVDGFNMEPEGVKVALAVSGTTLTLSLADGTSLGNSFNKQTEIALSDYAGGKVGAIRNDSYASVLTIYDFQGV